MFAIWKSADYVPDGEPLHFVETVEEVAAIIGADAEFLRRTLHGRSYIRVPGGWHIEPNR